MGKLIEEAKAAAEEDARLRETRMLERENAKLRSKLAQSEQKRKQAEADLEHSESRIDFIRSLDSPNPTHYEYKPLKASGQATAVLVLSDWHVEETVDPATINGVNEYNLEIAERRIKKMFENAVTLIESARTLSNIQDLVVACLGDFITGYIHPELEESNSLSPTEATLFASDHLVGGLELLRKHGGFKSITIPTCYGNHGRTTLKKRVGTAYKNSFEWLMYKHLERSYRPPKVQWKVENGYHNWLDIQGHAVRASHGDAFTYAGGVCGWFLPIRRKISAWDKQRKADWDIFGHGHTDLKDTKWSMNNCLIGFNAYGLGIGADETPPSQTLLVFDKKRRKPVARHEIWCD